MIDIWKDEVPGFDKNINQKEPSLESYIIGGKELRPAIIVCPGGGYEFKAPHEGGPIAEWLNSIGVSAFVLDYRVAPYRHPYPLLDLQRAIRYVRYNHKEFNVDPNRIGVLGFSAGGHLAASLSVHFDYDMDLSLFYEEFREPKTDITEIPTDKLDILINKMGILIENSKEDKTYFYSD